MLDALLVDLKTVCEQLLPILGAAALIYLCILLKHAWKLIDTANDTVKGLDPTVKLANESLEKVQAPLDTVVRLSHSVDDVQAKTAAAFANAGEWATQNVDKLKDFVSSKTSAYEAPSEPASEEQQSAKEEETAHE